MAHSEKGVEPGQSDPADVKGLVKAVEKARVDGQKAFINRKPLTGPTDMVAPKVLAEVTSLIKDKSPSASERLKQMKDLNEFGGNI